MALRVSHPSLPPRGITAGLAVLPAATGLQALSAAAGSPLVADALSGLGIPLVAAALVAARVRRV